jgi:hypothetical protein
LTPGLTHLAIWGNKEKKVFFIVKFWVVIYVWRGLVKKAKEGPFHAGRKLGEDERIKIMFCFIDRSLSSIF